MKALATITVCFLSLVATSPARAQQFQGGVAGVIGMGGIGLEIDAAHRRVGVYARAQASLDTGTRLAGARVYLIGQRNAGFYLSGARVQLHCARVRFGGVGSDCDGDWHNAWAVLGGVDLGSPTSQWSIFVDAGPFYGAREVPGLRDWTFVFGVRLRGPKD